MAAFATSSGVPGPTDANPAAGLLIIKQPNRYSHIRYTNACICTFNGFLLLKIPFVFIRTMVVQFACAEYVLSHVCMNGYIQSCCIGRVSYVS